VLGRVFGLLDRFKNIFKHFGFVFGEVGEDFAINGDIGLEKLVNELGIVYAMFAGGGIDFDGPELAHCAFLFLAVSELETPSV